MRKQLTVEDFAMVLQWVATFLLAPFVLLPLSPREPVSFSVRLAIVVGVIIGNTGMTLLFLKARKRSRYDAAVVVNITAILDVALVFTSLLLWPNRIPDIFWILPILIIVVATRFGYRETALVTLGLSVLYGITIVSRLGDDTVGTVVGDTLLRIGLMFMVAVITVYVTQREKRERRTSRVLSRVAAAMATLDPDELMDAVVESMSEAAGQGRCSAFFVGGDRRWAVARSTTEKDPGLREEFFDLEIDLSKANVASKVIKTREPIIINKAGDDPLLDRRWMKDFGIRALLVLPMILRNEVEGIVFVERRGIKRYFTDREAETCTAILAQAATGMENATRYADEQRKRSEVDIMYKTSRELGSSLVMDQVLESACKLAIRSTGAPTCSAFVLDEPCGMLLPRVSIGLGGSRVEFPEGSGVAVSEIEDMYNLAQRPPALILNRPVESSGLPPFLCVEGVALLAPFFSQGRISGFLCVADDEDREFSGDEKTRLAVVAGEAALAVVNARLHERIKSDAAQMVSLIQLTNAIGSTADLEKIMSIALDTVRHLFDCDSGLIYRIDADDGCLWYVDSFGYSSRAVEKISSGPYRNAGECWAVAQDTLVGIDDLSAAELKCRTLEKIAYGSTICVGMKVEGRTLGVLHIRSEKPNAFSEEDQQFALAIADQVALALQRATLFEEINRLAVTDPLTGVFNVRRLASVLADEVSRARRYVRPVSFLMVDVDNLKVYNDSLGHQRGDVVLSQIASIVDRNTRDVDKVFRYGGDEFCVVLPETDSFEAMVVAEKVRRAVSDFHFPGEEDMRVKNLTISIGVATFPQDTDEEDDLIRKADLALYAAKQDGRNSVSAAI
ncbi:MAG: diguanylate cyclase [Actinomycetia bacterium]|nr:diguanylate cyclase [Actinomycetes bacterium]